MADFLSLLTAIPSLLSNFSGNTVDPYKKKKEELASAMGDTNNPLYKQLYGQYRQQGATNLGSGIAELQRQNRMNNKMGRTPLFDQERGGESLFRNLMSGYEGLGTQADTQTRQNLQGQFANYTGMTPTTAKVNEQQNLGFNNIAELIRGNPLKQQSAPSYSPIDDWLKKQGYSYGGQ